VDYSSDLGKQMFRDAAVKYLPAVLFDSSVVGSSGYSQVQTYLSAAGSYQTLAIGAAYDPTCHNSDGSVKCDDPKCSSDTQCRTNVDKKLDLFIMSHCPYGIQALNSLKEVFGAVKDLKFNIHFIADYSNATGSFNSLHGQTEVDDDMRELCVMKYYPDNNKYMDFIWCRNNNISSSVWESCATSNGMDAVKLADCVRTEGVNLLKENIKLSQDLKIGASPTWLANNKYEFSGLAAQDIKTGICKYNLGMVGCDKTLTGATAATQAAANCAT